MTGRGWLAAALVAASTLGIRAGQAAGPSAQGPTFKVDVEYIEVEATVTDGKGEFVRGLTRDDFQVTEDGKPQAITSFGVVDIPIQRAEQPLFASQPIEPDVRSNAEPFDGRIYVLVIDDLHIDPLRTEKLKAAARQFVDRRLGANDLMAVIHTAGPDTANQEFTSNRRLLDEAVDRTIGRKTTPSALARADSLLASGGAQADDLEQPQRAANARTTMQVLERVADWFGSVRGRRKSILFMSEGVGYDLGDVIGSSSRPSGWSSDVYNQVLATIAAATRSNVAIYGIDPRGLTAGGDVDTGVSSFAVDQGAGAATFGLDAGGPGTAGGPDGHSSIRSDSRSAQDSLRVLSEETGGFAVVNSNQFGPAFARVVADNSSYYVLAYDPPGGQRDGKFHRIEVKVKRPGLTVRARKGYLSPRGKAPAPPAFDAKSVASPEMREVLSSPLPVTGGVTLRAFAAPFRDADHKASVLVSAEILGKGLSLSTDDTVELSYAAVDASGRTLDGRSHAIGMTNLKAETKTRVEQTGLRLNGRLRLAPGRYQLRFAARDSASGGLGSVLYDLEVPDFSAGALQMSGLVLTSSSGSQWPTLEPDEGMRQVLPGPAVALRRFPSDDELALFADVYDNQAATPHKVDITATVTADDGHVVFKSEDTHDAAELHGTTGGYGFSARLSLADLAPGPYVLTVEARSRLGAGASASRQTEFTVLPAQDATP